MVQVLMVFSSVPTEMTASSIRTWLWHSLSLVDYARRYPCSWYRRSQGLRYRKALPSDIFYVKRQRRKAYLQVVPAILYVCMLSKYAGPCFNIKIVFCGTGIPITKVRRIRNSNIFKTRIVILLRRYVHIETTPITVLCLLWLWYRFLICGIYLAMLFEFASLEKQTTMELAWVIWVDMNAYV